VARRCEEKGQRRTKIDGEKDGLLTIADREEGGQFHEKERIGIPKGEASKKE